MNPRPFRAILGSCIIACIVADIAIVTSSKVSNSKPGLTYRKYLLPGPFFDESRITDSHTMWVSRKVNGAWTRPINPLDSSFKRYSGGFNITALYRSRLERSLYYALVVHSPSWDKQGQDQQIESLIKYIDNRFPLHADSIRIVVISKYTRGFKVDTDTAVTVVR